MLIEDGHRNTSSYGTYTPTFAAMEVGQSVMIAGQNSYGKVANAARKWAKRNGRRFSTQLIDGGVRLIREH